MESNPDYITINPTVDEHKHNVVLMRFSAAADSYQVLRCSAPLPLNAAQALAASWSAATKAEIR